MKIALFGGSGQLGAELRSRAGHLILSYVRRSEKKLT